MRQGNDRERRIQTRPGSKGCSPFDENSKQMPKTPHLRSSQRTSSGFDDNSVAIVPDSIPSLGSIPASTEPTSSQPPNSKDVDNEIDGSAFWEDLIQVAYYNTAKAIAKTDVARNLKLDKRTLQDSKVVQVKKRKKRHISLVPTEYAESEFI
jgi:hypothetical protein